MPVAKRIVCNFAYANGYMGEMAKFAGLHRNTAVKAFRDLFFKKSTVKLRQEWKSLLKRKIYFPNKVYIFYNNVRLKPHFSKAEFEGLVNLWLMGMPLKVARTHFLLWSFRTGQGLGEISKNLRHSVRAIPRYREFALRPGSPVKKWLALLKFNKKDFYLLKGRA